MGEVWVRVKVGNLDWSIVREVDALVDTGATDTAIPAELAGELKIPIYYTDVAETASGEVEAAAGAAMIEIEGFRKVVPVAVVKNLQKVLIGQTALETFNLSVDPVAGRPVRRRKGLLLWPFQAG